MPKRLPVVLVGMLLLSTLINSDLFFYKSLTAFYGYVFTSVLLILYASALVIKNGFQAVDQKLLQLPLVLCFSGTGWFLLHAMATRQLLTNEYVFYILSCILFFLFFVLFFYRVLTFFDVCKVIAFLVLFECLICFLQWFHLIETVNTFFRVTGTWVNPNVTSMFLAASIPFLLFCITTSTDKVIKRFVIIVLILTVCCQCMLVCRTAIIGSVVGASWFLIKVNDKRLAIDQGKKRLLIPRLIVALIIGLLFASYLYSIKRDSADGRLLIWKISLNLVTEKPLLGFGYGSFEYQYNLKQAAYFQSGGGTPQERKNAGYVQMGYNEYLQNVIEGGVPGFIILLLLFFLLCSRKKLPANTISDNAALYASIAVIIEVMVMSVFNFTLQAIPLMALMVISGAVIFNTSSLNTLVDLSSVRRRLGNINYSLSYAMITILLVVAFGVCVQSLRESVATCQLKKTADRMRQGQRTDLRAVFESNAALLDNSKAYHIQFSKFLAAKKEYLSAIEQLKKARQITSDPAVVMQLGMLYEKVENFQSADSAYALAANLEPSKIGPRFFLMKLNEKLSRMEKAAAFAQEIVDMDVKVQSKEANYYKKSALTFLKQIK